MSKAMIGIINNGKINKNINILGRFLVYPFVYNQRQKRKEMNAEISALFINFFC